MGRTAEWKNPTGSNDNQGTSLLREEWRMTLTVVELTSEQGGTAEAG